MDVWEFGDDVILSFFAKGDPKTQGSKKAWSSVGTSKVVMREQIDPNHVWRGKVSEEAVRAARACGLPGPIDYPVRMGARFFLRKPGKPKFDDWPATRGDGDIEKLIRAINDGLQQMARGALVKAGVLKDDALVVQIAETTGKYWAPEGESDGVRIWLTQPLRPPWLA